MKKILKFLQYIKILFSYVPGKPVNNLEEYNKNRKLEKDASIFSIILFALIGLAVLSLFSYLRVVNLYDGRENLNHFQLIFGMFSTIVSCLILSFLISIVYFSLHFKVFNLKKGKDIIKYLVLHIALILFGVGLHVICASYMDGYYTSIINELEMSKSCENTTTTCISEDETQPPDTATQSSDVEEKPQTKKESDKIWANLIYVATITLIGSMIIVFTDDQFRKYVKFSFSAGVFPLDNRKRLLIGVTKLKDKYDFQEQIFLSLFADKKSATVSDDMLSLIKDRIEILNDFIADKNIPQDIKNPVILSKSNWQTFLKSIEESNVFRKLNLSHLLIKM